MKDKKNIIFRLNPTALLVKGIIRCVLIDIERQIYYLIPNALYSILIDNKFFSLDSLINKYKNKEILNEYYNFLNERDLIFSSSNIEIFQDIELNWDYPGQISNLIIDYNSSSKLNFKELSMQLSNYGTKHLQIRFFDVVSFKTLRNILTNFNKSTIEGIEILLPYSNEITIDNFLELMGLFKRLSYFIIYNSKNIELDYNNDRIVFVSSNIIDHKSCGIISPNYFTNNLSSISESHHYNTCLNRKISIDIDGNIKNCPSMTKSFGNIKDTTLDEALNKPEFKKYWNLKKDDITKCKDCEFRHICTDCRAYIEDPEDIYSAPLKCGYDPHTGEWSEWSDNPLKKKTLKFYGMEDLIVKDKK